MTHRTQVAIVDSEDELTAGLDAVQTDRAPPAGDRAAPRAVIGSQLTLRAAKHDAYERERLARRMGW